MAILQFKANPKQKEAFKFLFDSQHTDIGYGGGAGGGKSYIGVSWIWMQCNKYPGVRYAIGRNELKRLKQTTLASFFKFCADYEIPKEQAGVYNAQDGVILFENGSQVLLIDLSYQPSDPLYTRLGSLELTGAFVDESAEVDEQALMILATRIGRHLNDKYGIAPKLLQCFNPDKGHVYRNFYKPYKEDSLPPYRIFIPALATDNQYISKSYIAQLEKADEVTKQRLLYGNFDYDSTAGRLFEYKCILNLFSNPKFNGQRYISCDAARKGKDKAVIFVWDGFEIVDYSIFEKCTTVEIENKIKELQQKWHVGMSNVIVDEDGVGGGIVDSLECTGFINNSSPISPFGAKKTEFLRRNYANLKTQCYFELAKHVNDNKVRFACDSVEVKSALIEELDVVVQVDLDKDSKTRIISKEDIKKKLARSPDYSDAMMFRMFFELQKEPGENFVYGNKEAKIPQDGTMEDFLRMLDGEEAENSVEFDIDGGTFEESDMII